MTDMTNATDIRPADQETHEYEAARKRVERRRKFQAGLVAYVVINAGLVITWAITGGGYFWPAWVMAGWGIGLTLNAWDVYGRRPVTEADIDEEMRRLGH